MLTLERSRKRIHLWKKAMIHFSLCFTTGFFTGISLLNTSSVLSGISRDEFHGTKLIVPGRNSVIGVSSRSLTAEANSETLKWNQSEITDQVLAFKLNDPEFTESWHAPELNESELPDSEDFEARRRLIIITPMFSDHPLERKYLRTLGYTLKLVPQPLLWIVVTTQAASAETVDILRRTGVMYRHLVCMENSSSLIKLIRCQRNVALEHIGHHRLDGVVHFADVFNVYSLRFFEEIRETGVFATWPVALIYTNKKMIDMYGPVCQGSQVVGWHAYKSNRPPNDFTTNTVGFAFNSTILWDPQRWGRPAPTPNPTQEKVSLIRQAMVEDEAKMRGLATGCARVMVWRLRLHPLIPKSHMPR